MTIPNGPSRRKFLRQSAFGMVALWSSTFLPSGCSRYEEIPEDIIRQLSSFSGHEYMIMKAIAARIVRTLLPTDANADEISVALQADKFLAVEHPEVQRQFHQLLSIFNSPFFAFLFDFRFSSFLEMDPIDQDSYLRDWMTSNIPFRRTAFQALKRLCMRIYYTDDRTWESIGYKGPFISTQGNFD